MALIKDLKNMPEGTEVKGFPLCIKTARKSFRDADGLTWQEVVFMDASGEILGHILLGEDGEPVGHGGISPFHQWQSKTNICIMEGTVQYTDERKKDAMKLVVTECFDVATPLTWGQTQDIEAENWQKMREEEIKGKIRHGLVCADKSAGKTPDKDDILMWQNFIMTGE